MSTPESRPSTHPSNQRGRDDSGETIDEEIVVFVEDDDPHTAYEPGHNEPGHGQGHDSENGHGRPVTIVIEVNSQSVTVHQREATGAEIKAAAIAQGVAIQPGFVLSVKHGNRYDIVGDDDRVILHKGLDFVATDTDDNS